MVLPAGGAVVHEMMYTSGRECINVGKPCSTFLQIILEEHPLPKDFNDWRYLVHPTSNLVTMEILEALS